MNYELTKHQVGTLFQAMLLMLLGMAIPSFAEEAEKNPNLQLTKNDQGYFMIGSDAEYEIFRQVVNTGNPYANAILTNDVTAKQPIGLAAEEFHYRGTFDGNGHTVTLAMTDEKVGGNIKGLFTYTEPGAVIRNLKVTGEISASYICASIVGHAYGTRIENCISDVTIGGSCSTQGGIVGYSMGECFLENCAFIGSFQSTGSAGGLVGNNRHMVSIKSSYVAPRSSVVAGSMFANRISAVETFKNNYYCYISDTDEWTTDARSARVSKDRITSGWLCYHLNQQGRKGVVWYQNEDGYPYPFKTQGGKMIVSSDGGNTVTDNVLLCLHNFNNQVCRICGKVESLGVIEPLQNSGKDTEFKSDEIYVGYLRYNLTTTDGKPTATVRGTHHYNGMSYSGIENKDATAVHIPETIIYNGVEYTVTKIDETAFQNSAMQTCFIPKTVKRVENNAFNSCSSLNNLIIADVDDVGNSLWLGDDTDHWGYDDELFSDCPLTDVYIGRNLKWDSDMLNDAPFEDRQKLVRVFFGPRVSRVGNVRYGNDPRDGGNCELFDECKNIGTIYFMGDEKSYKDNLLVNVFNREGVNKATKIYVNRNFSIIHDVDDKENHTEPYTTARENGLFRGCKNVAYGPFVKSVANHTFFTSEALSSVDFKNAFNLTEIESYAFNDCNGEGLSTFRIPGSVMTIAGDAFGGKIKNLVFESSSAPLTITGDKGIDISLSTVSIDRDIINFHCKSGLWTIGPGVTTLRADQFTDNTASVLILYSETPLKCEKDMKLKVGDLLFLDRELEGENNNISFISNSKESMLALGFGANITEIPSRMFASQQKITSLLIPKNITKIGTAAFQHCTNLEVISILGEPTVESTAFSNEDKLKYLFLMGSTIDLKDEVFHYCENLKEVYTGFYQDPGASSPTAFDPIAYQNTTLSCAGEQVLGDGSMELTSEPWKRWKENGKQHAMVATNLFSYKPEQMGKDGLYNRAVLSHNFTNGQMELVYLPFDVDSYYFGIDADIYRLTIEDELYQTYDNSFVPEKPNSTKEHSFEINYIKFKKVNIDTEKMLAKGNVYLVKVKNHDENSLSGHYSLYESHGISIDKNNWTYTAAETYRSSPIRFGMWPQTTIKSDADHKYYTSDNGVIKLINGEYPLDISTVIIEGDENIPMNFDLKEGTTTLTTSRTVIPFNEHLEGYSTFYAADYNYVAPDWCDVYIVTGTENGKEVELAEITDRTITKGQAVLLKSNNDATINGGLSEYLTYATHGSSCSFAGNLLKGVDRDQFVSELNPNCVFALDCNDQSQNAGFYKLLGYMTITKGSAYLDPEGLSADILDKSCLFAFNGTTTNIRPAEREDAMQGIYDLMGRRLKEAGFKGIYILNGKKIVIKL